MSVLPPIATELMLCRELTDSGAPALSSDLQLVRSVSAHLAELRLNTTTTRLNYRIERRGLM
jgi:hypothetical protein